MPRSRGTDPRRSGVWLAIGMVPGDQTARPGSLLATPAVEIGRWCLGVRPFGPDRHRRVELAGQRSQSVELRPILDLIGQ
jgi:hypothetical protein